MSHTPQEKSAMQRDIEKGLEQMLTQLTGWHKAMPVAIEQLHPAATSTRTLLKVNTMIIELGLELQKVLRVGIQVKEDKK